jgi:hypothetical protein
MLNNHLAEDHPFFEKRFLSMLVLALGVFRTLHWCGVVDRSKRGEALGVGVFWVTADYLGFVPWTFHRPT